MEYKSYLNQLGSIVYEERRKLKMSQTTFYRFLFPTTNKEDENIKKKMNAIENGKTKYVDYEFILTFCDKCDVSADYLLKKNINYRNHELEIVCDYTGLSQNAAMKLHDFQEAKKMDVDLSLVRRCAVGDESQNVQDAFIKSTAIDMLYIINYLFNERSPKDYPKINDNKSHESNLSIIYDIYRYCIANPELLNGIIADETNNEINVSTNQRVNLNLLEFTMLKDTEEIWYPFDIKKIYKQIAKEELIKDLDKLSEQYETDTGIKFEGTIDIKEAIQRKMK